MKKMEGFPGQISYVIPEKILDLIRKNPLISDLYVTDIGYYPHASHHFRERTEGINQTILIYNTGGMGTINLAGKKIQLPADHFLFIPAYTPHSYCADLKTPWSIYWIHFSGPKATQISKPEMQAVPVSRTTTSRINERIELFDEIFKNLDRGFSVETLEYINLCLPRLLSSFSHLEQYRSFNEHTSKDPISRSINFMIENTTKKYRLEELSEVVGLSASHYSRLFLSRTGHSPIDYFIQLKIQRSCRLLDNTKLSVADIARESGFEDQFYFSRQFKRVMNMSPREYRNRI